jgi:hypothetical protein
MSPQAAVRVRLPNRRACETFDVSAGSLKYRVTVGRFADGRVAELFISNGKVPAYDEDSDISAHCSPAYDEDSDALAGAALGGPSVMAESAICSRRERVIRMNEKPTFDQYHPGGVAQQSLDWNIAQHDAIGGGEGSDRARSRESGESPSLLVSNNISTEASSAA